jgi:hypothetical protein
MNSDFIWIPDNEYNIEKGAYSIYEVIEMIKFLSVMLNKEAD